MKYQHGQTLVELILSFTVAVIVISAITFVVINSLKNAQYSKYETLATQYAQQGIEIIRNMRYIDYASFNGLPSGSYCLADSCTGVNTTVGGNCGPVGSQCNTTPNLPLPSANSIFIRQVNIQSSAVACSAPTASSGTGTQVMVTVSWTDGQCLNAAYCHQVSSTTCITTFDVIPTP